MPYPHHIMSKDNFKSSHLKIRYSKLNFNYFKELL